MATYDIQPRVDVGENGDSYNADLTDMGLYLGLLGFDLQMKATETDILGSLAIGMGNIFMERDGSVSTLKNINKNQNLHIYFYKDENVVNSTQLLPSFLDEKLNFSESKVVMYASNKGTSDTKDSIKEGSLIQRDSDILSLSKRVGNTYNFPIGTGTGVFNNFCVSLCDLKQLKTLEEPIFIGRMFASDGNTNYNYETSVYPTNAIAYIRNGVEGITAANEFLIKFLNKTGLWTYNLETGALTPYTGDYTGYMQPWGQNLIEIEGIYYGITNEETTTEHRESQGWYIFSYNPQTGEQNLGSTLISSYFSISSGLIKVGSDLFVNTNTTSPNYRKVNLDTLGVYYDTLTVSGIPERMGNSWFISNTDTEGEYILHDFLHYQSFYFTDLSNVENTITKAVFVSCGLPITVSETKTVYASNTIKGFYTSNSYSESNTIYNIFKNTIYSGRKSMLCSEAATPLLTYAGFGKDYDKGESVDFTTTYYIQSQKGSVI